MERINAVFADVFEVNIPAMGAKLIWQMSLLAKKSPSATSLFVVTPRGGGLDISVWIMGRSIVSWSVSLNRAVATSRTTNFRRVDWGMEPPPRTVIFSTLLLLLLLLELFFVDMAPCLRFVIDIDDGRCWSA